jgi:hypothetical protein
MCRVMTRMGLLMLLTGCSFVSPPGRAQQPVKVGPSEFTIGGAVKMPLAVSVQDLHRMSRTTLHVTNPHNHQQEVYEGVPLAALLEQAGVPQGEQIRGPWMASFFRWPSSTQAFSTQKCSWPIRWMACPSEPVRGPSSSLLRTKNGRRAGYECSSR